MYCLFLWLYNAPLISDNHPYLLIYGRSHWECVTCIHSFGIQHIIHSVCVCRHVFNSSASYCVSCYVWNGFLCIDIIFAHWLVSVSVLWYVCVLRFSRIFSHFPIGFLHKNIIYRTECFIFFLLSCWYTHNIQPANCV